MGGVAIGAVAQLGERRPCKAEVVGSIPISSTTRSRGDRVGRPLGCAVARSLGRPRSRARISARRSESGWILGL